MKEGLKGLESLMNDYYEMCQDLGNNDDQYQRNNLTSERAIIEKALKDGEEMSQELDIIKSIFKSYGVDYKLVHLREAVLLLKQFQGTYGKGGQKLITDKLKALETIRIIKKSVDNSSETCCVLPNGKKITCDMGYVVEFIKHCLKEYPELKEVLTDGK